MPRPSHSTGSCPVQHGVAGWMTTGNDRVLIRCDLGLFGVFDGVGSSRASGRAAGAAQGLVGELVEAGAAGCTNRAEALRLLTDAVQEADRAVAAVAADEPPEVRMNVGTTATVVWLWNGPGDQRQAPVALIAHVGDSRVQLVRDGRIRSLTLDHSVFGAEDSPEAWARQDRLDEAATMAQLSDPLDRSAFSHRNQLAAALAGDGFPSVRTYAVELQPGDRLAIDSDGVHDNLTGTQLGDLLGAEGQAQDLADHVAGAARACADGEGSERAKPDDMSVVVLMLGPA